MIELIKRILKIKNRQTFSPVIMTSETAKENFELVKILAKKLFK
jgi:hypothetical protein